MQQTYSPALNVGAIRGWCLKYIDDAGNAPARTATARYSWEVERNAGRIRNTELPENVWVVGWLDFTAGLYQTYGHVFFIKRNGSNYSIYDSEVGAGARKPYGSINELLAWFGAYSPIYLGWSTDCDGRNYAKEGETMTKIDEEGVRILAATILERVEHFDTTPDLAAHIGGDALVKIKEFWNSPEGQDASKWRRSIRKTLADKDAEIAKLKQQLSSEYVKVSDLYIKK